VVEAAPERLELKRELFARLSALVGPQCVLATNTSSLPVTAVAGAASRPERVVGMHFFNPAPVMRLLEVVAGERSGEAALAVTRATGEAMGRHVIDAADGPGFLVNRCNRPFSLEALRLVSERLATPEQVDRICRLGGGFRMGPFELMDLVGVDVGLEVSRSFFELSFGEPRWRPSPLVSRLVAAGRLGRKAGRGWYAYDDGPHRPPDPEAPTAGGGGRVAVHGAGRMAQALRTAATGAGWELVAEDGAAELVLDCAPAFPAAPGTAPRAVLCAAGSLRELDPGGAAVGFHATMPLTAAGLVELTRTPASDPVAAAAAERLFASLGLHHEWVGDAPGLVLGRITAQLVNEACFALGEGVGRAADIDAGMVLGLNHPRGPLEWGDALGPEAVLGTLRALRGHYGEERYRAAPELVRRVRDHEPLRSA